MRPCAEICCWMYSHICQGNAVSILRWHEWHFRFYQTTPFCLSDSSTFTKTIEFHTFNTLRPRQDGRHFPDDHLKCIFLNENIWISLKISLKFVPDVRINKIPALVQIMAWRRPGDKPLSEPMMVSLLTHICVTRSQWVKFTRDSQPNFIRRR